MYLKYFVLLLCVYKLRECPIARFLGALHMEGPLHNTYKEGVDKTLLGTLQRTKDK